MNGLNAKSVLAPAAVLLVICILVSAALAGTNLLTRDRIAEAAAKKAEESRMVVLPQAETFEELDGHYAGVDGSGNSVGYVFETEGKGYGGSVNVMTGISTDGSITGVVLLSHGETPGLGGAAVEELPAQIMAAQSANIDGRTGATITSDAIKEALSAALAQAKA